ncbi:hypothetical protein DL546_007388 [Coniochaeta pulveracea]|uniref:Uncharacterized protein n=1 Tax=Coniochaeta pulveracea TaxID=177199 RepID=A0A420YEX7_9PEZI|nr:hypothetical protein DL546_007388 [Coniochaeta pulveracea]
MNQGSALHNNRLALHLHVSNLSSSTLGAMCDYTKNYYVYTSCLDPGAHFFRTSIDGSKKNACPKGPHERYIMIAGQCPLCG